VICARVDDLGARWVSLADGDVLTVAGTVRPAPPHRRWHAGREGPDHESSAAGTPAWRDRTHPDRDREAGSDQDRELCRVEQGPWWECELGDEQRHREADATDESDEQEATPRDAVGARRDAEPLGGERCNGDAERLAGGQADDDTGEQPARVARDMRVAEGTPAFASAKIGMTTYATEGWS
jgi:hypothetical protein